MQRKVIFIVSYDARELSIGRQFLNLLDVVLIVIKLVIAFYYSFFNNFKKPFFNERIMKYQRAPDLIEDEFYTFNKDIYKSGKRVRNDVSWS